MKIVAGLGSIDDYIRLVKAGADEVFCGYVPYEWNKKYGTLFPLNRREVLYYNVQIGSLEDMKILKKMVDIYKVPVTITFNYLYYLEEQYEIIEDIMNDLIEVGFNEFIIADISLILYLQKRNIKCSIHLSGECAEINTLSLKFFNKLENITRYIFHRKNTLEDMKSCISNNNVKNMEYEAFILNERCHYTGAFCSSFHCDELEHICKIPYIMGKVSEKCNNFKNVDERLEKYYEENIEFEEQNEYVVGSTGCGICNLKRLQQLGVTHLKVVGRGNFVDNMDRDIKKLKQSINMLNNIDNAEKYEDYVKDNLFKNKCSKECYY